MREKVIMGLERCIEKLNTVTNKTHGFNCTACPYSKRCDSSGYLLGLPLMKDALALLKAQEPRVMTLEEVNALDWDYCYLEQERLPGKEYRVMLGKYIMTCVTWPSITASKITYGAENYGKTWRCWTTRPTDEQRKAAKWDDA